VGSTGSTGGLWSCIASDWSGTGPTNDTNVPLSPHSSRCDTKVAKHTLIRLIVSQFPATCRKCISMSCQFAREATRCWKRVGRYTEGKIVREIFLVKGEITDFKNVIA